MNRVNAPNNEVWQEILMGIMFGEFLGFLIGGFYSAFRLVYHVNFQFYIKTNVCMTFSFSAALCMNRTNKVPNRE